MSYYSQCGEDKWIEENLHPQVGTFCEVGAYNGVLSSNTLHFEEQGWRGILIEPDPLLATYCRDKRSNSKVFCCAAGYPGISMFPINEADRGLSGFNRPGKPIPVIIVPLWQILSFFSTQGINLLSIDTEGTELEVWETVGFYRPEIVLMEYQTCDEPPKDKLIVERMARTGYKEVHRTQYNLIFTR